MTWCWSAGAAGLRAAIAIAQTHAELSVAVVSVYPMRSHTVSAEGGAAAVIGADDSLTSMPTTRSRAATLRDQDAVEAFVAKHRRSCCDWNTGVARGAARLTGARGPLFRGHAEDAYVVRGGQDRLSPASYAVSNDPQVRPHRPIRRVVRDEAARGRRAGAGSRRR